MTVRLLNAHSGNLYGGIETILVSLARNRAACPDLEPGFALCFPGRLADALRQAGTAPADLGPVRASRPWSIRRARRALAHLLRQRPADAVAVHSPWSLALLAPGARAAGIPVILWLHAALEGGHWLERWAARHPPDLVIANSRFTAQSVPRRLGAVPTDVVYAPIPAPAGGNRERIRAAFGVDHSTAVILIVARIEPGKGHLELIEALAVMADPPPWTAWVVGAAQRPGERRLESRLRARVGALGLGERVRFLGERADVSELMAAADVYCQPGARPESFGVTFVEALYAGLPVVTTAIGGALEIVGQSSGLLVPPNDAAALAAALTTLLSSPAARRRLGAAGPTRALELCDPARQLARVRDLVRGIGPRHRESGAPPVAPRRAEGSSLRGPSP